MKLNEIKILYIVIIGLLIIVGILLFRSCVSSDRTTINGIRRIHKSIETGIKLAENILSESMAELAELERINIVKDTRIAELEKSIESFRASLDRIASRFETEITAGVGAIERSRNAVNGIESIVDRIQETATPEKD